MNVAWDLPGDVRDNKDRGEKGSQGVVDSVQGSCERTVYCFDVLERNRLRLAAGGGLVIAYLRKPVQKAALRRGVEPSHGCVNDGIQKLFEHLLGSPESRGILHDEGQKQDKPTADSNGRKDSHVEYWVLICRRKLEILGYKRHVGMHQSMVVSGRVQVMEGGHRRLRDEFMLRGNERRKGIGIKF